MLHFECYQLDIGLCNLVTVCKVARFFFTIKIFVSVSTTCSERPEMDSAGPKLAEAIKTAFPDCQVTFKRIVTDDLEQISDVLYEVASAGLCDVLFTVGGTGFAPSDVTPEATRRVIDKEAPGLAYALISNGLGTLMVHSLLLGLFQL